MRNYQYAEYSNSIADLKSVDAHSLMKDETKNTTFKAMASQNNIKSDIRQALDEAPRMLAFASEEYNISKDIKDYILVPSVIMPSDLPNKNGVAFPYEELTKFSVDYKNISYKTWANCPSHIEHQNDEPRNAKGMVFASFMKKMPGYKGDIYKVICLVGCDRSKDKILANEVLDQSEVSTSMGALCEDYRCSITGNLLSSGKAEQYTKRTKPSFQTVGNKLAFLSVVNFHGIEVSFVKNPAYTSARSKHRFTYDN